VRKLDKAIAESLKDPSFIENASADAPVLAYLPGEQWTASLQQNRKLLEPLARTAPSK
jgi:tripartite-type tricarboxylate transporter receptor subunit TctC